MNTTPADQPPPRTSSTETVGVRSAAEILTATGAILGPAVRTAITRLPGRIEEIAAYHCGLDVRDASRPEYGGKAIRAALTLLSCEAADGDQEQAIVAAVAVELVHHASLLHDDIIDTDRFRRARPAAWVRFGTPAALLTGDALFFLAVELLTETGGRLATTGVGALAKTVRDLIHGEYTDSVTNGHNTTTVAEIEAVAAAKTAVLMARACALGAVAAGADDDTVTHLYRFGHHLGLAFQYTDDLLGLWGRLPRTGKPVGTDLAARRKTLPIVYALTTTSASAGQLTDLYHSRDPLTPQQIEWGIQLVEQAGGRAWAMSRAEHHRSRALEHLDAADPARPAATELTALADLIITRDK
ncbi:polyprenyl synthetase family protein [Nocardia sp. NPDC057227]|uniref:polyprenyl synthetase family protein n=1 Tax=Nocardia sp. NPDC057227 TaxID=3346056 RepID=UPI0036324190